MESYIIAFRAGSSGRFLANILYSILTESQSLNFKLSQYNSTHLDNKHCASYRIIEHTKTTPGFPGSEYSSKNFYTNFEFVSNPGVVHTHVPPKFDIIKQRFPETKIIIITIKDNDYQEVVGNSIFKNGMENLENNNLQPNNTDSRLLLKIYFNLFGKYFDGQTLTESEKKEIINAAKNFYSDDPLFSYYSNPVVDMEFKDKTLLIDYGDMVRKPNYVIDTLANFSGKTQVDISVQQYYNAYLEGRKKLIQQHMPWVEL